MKPIDPGDLNIFLAIANHRSFRKASVELGVTASALSHALRGIEERLGLRLLNRTTRSVALTEAGDRLYARLKPAFRDIDDAIEDLNSLRNAPTGTLRLNAALPAARQVLLPIANRFVAAFPGIRVEIAADSAVVDVVSEGFDAGVRFGEIIAADMIAVPIGPRQRSAVIATPSFFERYAKPATPQDLLHLPCLRLRFSSGAYYRWEFERGGKEVAIEVDGPLTLSEMDLIVDAARAGNAIGYVFESMVEEELKDGSLVRVLADWCPYYPGFFLYYPSRRQVPGALRAFIDFVKAAR
jgi:DNA-binding transcriptional LysR family regulator